MEIKNTTDVFERYLPDRVDGDKELAESIGASFQFHITGDDGGDWVLDFTGDVGAVTPGTLETPDCTIHLASEDVPALFNNPASGLKLMVTGRLKVEGKPTVAAHLLKVL